MKKILENLNLFDGEAFHGAPCDVEIADGKIAAIRPPAHPPEKTGGELCTPAWIDVHSHSDISCLAAPACISKTSGGIGVEIVGNCGLSAFPVTQENRAHLENLYRAYSVPLTWSDCAGYSAAVKKANVLPRVETLTGHNTLRAAVMGYSRRQCTASDLAAMERLLAREMESGALGLSTGLLYVPGRFAAPQELSELLKVVADSGGIYTTHLRSEGDRLVEAVAEAIGLCENSGLRKLHISHLKTSGERNWPKLEKVFSLLAEAEKRGVSVTFDRYAYCCSMTQLSVAAGDDYIDMSDRAIEDLLQTPQELEKITKALSKRPETYWRRTILVNTRLPAFAPDLGKPLAQIAAEHSVSAPRLVAEILKQDSVGATAAFSVMCRKNMAAILEDPRCFCGSDESARPQDYSLGRSHIRNFGNSARFFRALCEKLGTAAAVRRMTGDPASRFGLTNCGFQIGARAAFTFVEPGKIEDRATFAAPHTPSTGVRFSAL